jgi:hypothetical protein
MRTKNSKSEIRSPKSRRSEGVYGWSDFAIFLGRDGMSRYNGSSRKRVFRRTMALAVLSLFAIRHSLFADAGETGAQFLELPIGARAIAMGGAHAAVARDGTALHYNPAALATLDGGNVTAMYGAYFEDMSNQHLAVAHDFGLYGAWALSYQGMAYGDFDRTDNTGQLLGSFKPKDQSFGVGMGKTLGKRWDVGGGVKMINSEITEQASAVALDVGARARFRHIALALSAANLGTGIKYRETEDDLPMTLRFGTAFHALEEGRWITAADIIAPAGTDPYAALGTEYGFMVARSTMAVRGGYNTRTSGSDLNGITGFSAGFGLDVIGITLDYAWAPFGDLGDTHRVSLGYRWGQLAWLGGDDELVSDSSADEY